MYRYAKLTSLNSCSCPVLHRHFSKQVSSLLSPTATFQRALTVAPRPANQSLSPFSYRGASCVSQVAASRSYSSWKLTALAEGQETLPTLRIASYTQRPTFHSLPQSWAIRHRLYSTVSPRDEVWNSQAKVAFGTLPVEGPADSRHLHQLLLLTIFLSSGYWLFSDPKDTVLYSDDSSGSSPLVMPKYMDGEHFSIPSAQEVLDADPRIALRNKSTYQLLVSMLVYNACTFESLTALAPDLLQMIDRLKLSPAAHWFIKKTFFAQFCGGETDAEVIGTMEKLRQSRIGAMLDLAIEVDIDQAAHDDGDEHAAREMWNKRADQVTENLKQSIITCSAQQGSFAALKITGIANPVLLQRLSNIKYGLRELFHQEDKDGDGYLDFEGFYALICRLPGAAQEDLVQRNQQISDLWASVPCAQHYHDADCPPERVVVMGADWADIERVLSFSNPKAQPFMLSSTEDHTRVTSTVGPYTFESLTQDDLEDYTITLRRARELASLASEHNVRLGIDAEQTYFQPAIDHFALELAREFNQLVNPRGPLVYNTYQMYLKDGYQRLVSDYTRAHREGFQFGVKLVRGAYMVSERKRASSLGLPDPINNTIEDTHASFNAGIKFLLDSIHYAQTKAILHEGEENNGSHSLKRFPGPALFVASHNHESVKYACELMEQYHIPVDSDHVMFGQLMGMQDAVTYSLGNHGYKVYKYIPYGPVNEVMPYLIRRAQENSSVLGGVQSERQNLWTELLTRMTGKMPVTTTHSNYQHPTSSGPATSPSTSTASSNPPTPTNSAGFATDFAQFNMSSSDASPGESRV
ncbi:proline dehydrogenase [Dispira simplex]|nr:proline dehydrogenase [Dispira simplex]